MCDLRLTFPTVMFTLAGKFTKDLNRREMSEAKERPNTLSNQVAILTTDWVGSCWRSSSSWTFSVK